MTAACSGGVSAPKLGAQLTIGIGSAKIAQLLSLAEGAFWTEVIPLLVVPEILLSSFCSSDPPAYPSFTQPEADDLLNLNFTPAFFTGLPKLVALVQRLVWYDQCYCQSGTLIPNTNVPAAPVGTHIIAQPVPQPGAGCGFEHRSGQLDQLSYGYPWGGTSPFPTGVTSMSVHLQIGHSGVGGNTTSDITWTLIQNGGLTQQNTSPAIHFNGTTPIDAVYTFSVPVGTTTLAINLVGGGPAGNYTFTTDVSLFCSGANPGTQQPCCPPDATTQATLNAILKMVTLIQRQGDPFGYNFGPAHSGLTGSGELAVSGLLGVRVIMTTIPPGLGSEEGDITEYFDAGWFCWGTPDGFDSRIRLTHSPQMSMPDSSGSYTRLSYTLTPGVAVTITEIVREP